MSGQRHGDHLARGVPVQLGDATLASLRPVAVPAGTVLFHAGDADDRLYIVLEGEVALIEGLDSPSERLTSVRGPGDLLGELSIFQRERPHRFTGRARVDTQVLVLPRGDVDDVLRREPLLAYELLRVASTHLHRTHRRATHTLEAKNQELAAAYEALERAQAQLLAQERVRHELRLARTIQEQMLPAALPRTQNLDIAARIVPAHEVGGDFYDVFWLDEVTLGLLIGDVCGKGMPAALYMAQTRSLIRAAATPDAAPATVLRQVNAHLRALTTGEMFATAVYATLAVPTGGLTIARAGHEYPILRTAAGSVTIGTPGTGQPLGLLPDPTIDVQVHTLAPGETLVLFTDGVTDMLSPDEAMFGSERLCAAMQTAAQESADRMCDDVVHALRAFQGSASQADDITLLVVHHTAVAPSSNADRSLPGTS